MARTIADREVRPLTADEVMRMVELGILDEDEPVELLHGALTRMSSKTPEHEVVKMRLMRWLVLASPEGGHDVRVEGPIVVPDRNSLPEPDLTVVRAGGVPKCHPRSALLVIEVAVSSLRIDLRIKPPLLAAAGVPEMWVAEPLRRRVHRFTEPDEDGYAHRTVHEVGETLTPQHVQAPPLALVELFAGL